MWLSYADWLNTATIWGHSGEDAPRQAGEWGQYYEEAIQRKLLAERELTYDSALRIAQGLETAARDLKEMQNPGAGATPTVKNEPTNNVQTRPNRACHRCGVQGHFANKC